MGQYFLIVNKTKKECLHPHRLGYGMKLWEICANDCLNVLGFLLRQSSESGGGDIRKEYKNAGRWAGDNIVIVGDYDNSGLFEEADGKYKEITSEIREEWNDFIEIQKLKICKDGFDKCPDCVEEDIFTEVEKERVYCQKHDLIRKI